MYRKENPSTDGPEKFELPFEGQLSPENRWIAMANEIPWSEFEDEYANLFSSERGAPALPFRMALGALIIKETLGTSDRETVEQIRENPYLQYLIGKKSYSNDPPFDASMLVYFRERIDGNFINKINLSMVKKTFKKEVKEEKKNLPAEEINGNQNRGKLIVDATCAPADISYPTDLNLLNRARTFTEKIIDILYEPLKRKFKKKPVTHRKRARKEYLKVSKKRRATGTEIRTAIKQQLQYVSKNLSTIKLLIEKGASLEKLSKRQYKILLVVSEVYRQQQWMFENNKKQIEDRIVSLNQPHVRPIVRGKAGKKTEFGAKISASCIDGYVFLDKISWDNFNESTDLGAQIEAFKDYTGCYPESVHADQIYRTRENRKFCKDRGIRISGPPLGRPPANVSQAIKNQQQLDEKIRNSIEGKFGVGKRRFSLDRVMTKLSETSETAIAITFLVMNLSTLLKEAFSLFLRFFYPKTVFAVNLISKTYFIANNDNNKL